MLAFYISGHGFGHASRDIEVLNALGRLAPDVPVTVRTSAPKWLFDLTLTRPVDFHVARVRHRHRADRQPEPRRGRDGAPRVGVSRAAGRPGEREARVASARSARASWSATSRRWRVPPAHAAGLPVVALGNFTWDWIYEGYRDWLAPGSDLIETLGDAYALADTALRLPMHGGFATMREVVDLPFIARRSIAHAGRHTRAPRAAARSPAGAAVVRRLRAAAHRPGRRRPASTGYTRRRDRRCHREPSRQRGARQAPGAASSADQRAAGGRARRCTGTACGTKTWSRRWTSCSPSPATASSPSAWPTTPRIVYTSRGHFVEYDVLVREMPRWLRCGFISNDDLLAGRWQARARRDARAADAARDDRRRRRGTCGRDHSAAPVGRTACAAGAADVGTCRPQPACAPAGPSPARPTVTIASPRHGNRQRLRVGHRRALAVADLHREADRSQSSSPCR